MRRRCVDEEVVGVVYVADTLQDTLVGWSKPVSHSADDDLELPSVTLRNALGSAHGIRPFLIRSVWVLPCNVKSLACSSIRLRNLAIVLVPSHCCREM